MENKTLQNPEVKMPNTPEFNDRDIANEALFTEKNISSSYNLFLTEISNDILFKRMLELHHDVIQAHRNIYNLMFEKGWYKVELEDKTKIETNYDQFNNYKSQLN